jgi:transcriptional activator of cad operon
VIFFISFTVTIFIQYCYQEFIVDGDSSAYTKTLVKKEAVKVISVEPLIHEKKMFSYDLNSGTLVNLFTDVLHDFLIPSQANHSNKIAFLSSASGSNQVWIIDENEKATIVSDSPISIKTSNLMWSSDDQKILFLHEKEVFSLDINNKQLKRLIDINHQPSFVSWSISGECVFYASKKSGQIQIWQYDMLTKKHLIITVNGGSTAKQNSRGKLFVTKQQEKGVWTIELDNKRPTGFSKQVSLIADLKVHKNYWQLSNDDIYYLMKRKNLLSLFKYSFNDKSYKEVFILDKKTLAYFSIKNDIVLFSKKSILEQ